MVHWLWVVVVVGLAQSVEQVDWRKSYYLNLILHNFEYELKVFIFSMFTGVSSVLQGI